MADSYQCMAKTTTIKKKNLPLVRLKIRAHEYKAPTMCQKVLGAPSS